MGSDKRSVATDALETLGTLIDDTQKRDAIHLAVAPVVAGEPLRPGDHITVTDGVATATEVGEGLGIVDPFLSGKVFTGQRFWFVLYPRTVQSLRHVWTHPAFPDTPSVGVDRAASESWLREFCRRSDCPDYETVMEAIQGVFVADDHDHGGSIDDDYLFFRGSDAHGEIPPEFWTHAEIVLGKRLANKPTHFSCSC